MNNNIIVTNSMSCYTKKRQRKTGGSKTVYIINLSNNLYNTDREFFDTMLCGMGGTKENGYGTFLFKKRSAYEKAFIWINLRVE